MLLEGIAQGPQALKFGTRKRFVARLQRNLGQIQVHGVVAGGQRNRPLLQGQRLARALVGDQSQGQGVQQRCLVGHQVCGFLRQFHRARFTPLHQQPCQVVQRGHVIRSVGQRAPQVKLGLFQVAAGAGHRADFQVK